MSDATIRQVDKMKFETRREPVVRAIRFLAPLLALCLVACGPLPRAEPVGLPLSKRATIKWQFTPGSELRRNMLDMIDGAELVYRARFGGGPVPVRAVVFEDAYLLRLDGRKVLGYVRGGVIHLPTRGVWPGVAIVHELHHVAKGRRDHRGHDWRVVNWLGRAWWAEFWGLA